MDADAMAQDSVADIKDEAIEAADIKPEDQDAPRQSRSRSRSRSRSPSHRRERSYTSRSRSRSPRRDRESRGSERERGPKWANNGDRDRESRRYADRGDRYADRGDRDRDRPSRGSGGGGGGYGRDIAATEAARRSRQDCRVYVGNLAFAVRWNDLKDYMRDAGNVVFSEVLMLPDGRSKGCGVVEYSTPEEAQRAIRDLNDQPFMGRPLFIREDREEQPRYGSAAVSSAPYDSGRGGRGGFRGGRGGFGGGIDRRDIGKQLYVGGLNAEVGWQDLKDLFRQAGDIIRADIKFDDQGYPNGSGSVVFSSPSDAQNAISMFHGAELNGMKLEVRLESGFAAPTSGPFGAPRSGPFASGGGGGSVNGDRGARAPSASARSTDGLYNDYSGPAANSGAPMAVPAYDPGVATRVVTSSFPNAQPSPQIFVKNLPWSTTNDDLVELFQTTGTVQFAEVLWEAGRSKGVGIVQFLSQEEAETAIQKFQLYSYGGRALSIEFNGRWRDFNAMPVVDHDALAGQGGGY